jgi:hypothetical protein
MLVDGLYLTAVLLLCPVVLFVLDTEKLKSLLALTPHVSRELALYGSAWMAGMLGETRPPVAETLEWLMIRDRGETP